MGLLEYCLRDRDELVASTKKRSGPVAHTLLVIAFHNVKTQRVNDHDSALITLIVSTWAKFSAHWSRGSSGRAPESLWNRSLHLREDFSEELREELAEHNRSRGHALSARLGNLLSES